MAIIVSTKASSDQLYNYLYDSLLEISRDDKIEIYYGTDLLDEGKQDSLLARSNASLESTGISHEVFSCLLVKHGQKQFVKPFAAGKTIKEEEIEEEKGTEGRKQPNQQLSKPGWFSNLTGQQNQQSNNAMCQTGMTEDEELKLAMAMSLAQTTSDVVGVPAESRHVEPIASIFCTHNNNNDNNNNNNNAYLCVYSYYWGHPRVG